MLSIANKIIGRTLNRVETYAVLLVNWAVVKFKAFSCERQATHG